MEIEVLKLEQVNEIRKYGQSLGFEVLKTPYLNMIDRTNERAEQIRKLANDGGK